MMTKTLTHALRLTPLALILLLGGCGMKGPLQHPAPPPPPPVDSTLVAPPTVAPTAPAAPVAPASHP